MHVAAPHAVGGRSGLHAARAASARSALTTSPLPALGYPVLERLRNNFGLKMLSLAIAVGAWAYLRLAPNPVGAARFVQTFSVPITTTGLRADRVARYTERLAVVSVVVPRTGTIKPDDLHAVLDLEGRSVGVYNVPVEVIAPKLEIRSLSPASVTLSIERIEDRTLPVYIAYTGGVRRNVVVERAAINPPDVTVRAPTSDLTRVSAVRVDVPFPSSPGEFDGMVRPVATDQRGAEVPGVAMAPNLLRVNVRFIAAAGKAR